MHEDDENIMSILIASDIHLGYAEKNPIRGKDSFIAFEEILMIAKERKVDFLLLGGDLFHENKPSRKTLHSAMELFRKYCLGDRPCQVEVVSDQSVNFGHTSSSVTSVNYEDPNLNISLPVFSIHGNHDDPTGDGALSAIDILSVAGLLNHFGKQTNLESISLSPVLLKKGTTKLALYGLGAIRDERLNRLFSKRLVTMLRPREDVDDWYNIFVLHQNRAKHGQSNYIPEQFIDSFFDLVVWGHEHECLIGPQWNSVKNFFVIQPGSPVATSLCEGESKPKHVAILNIRGREMKQEIIRLRTPRQLYVETIKLSDKIKSEGKTEEELEEAATALCEERVERFLVTAEEERSGHRRQPPKPLIRLRVDYSDGFEMFNAYRFGAKFTDRVANPDNIVHFLKKSSRRGNGSDYDVKDMDDMIGAEVVEKVKMEDLVQDYLDKKDKKEQMSLLTARGVSHAVSEYVNKHERDAISELCDHQISKTKEHLDENDTNPDRNDITLEISKFHDEKERRAREKASLQTNEDSEELQAILERARQKRRERGEANSDVSSDEGRVNIDESGSTSSTLSKAAPSKRGRGRGRGGRGSRGGGRGRGRNSSASASANNSSSFEKSNTIMSAFQRQSQAKATSQYSRQATQPVITLDDDSDDDSPAISSSKRNKPVATKRGRSKGITYVSSDEDDNPFNKFRSKRKK